MKKVVYLIIIVMCFLIALPVYAQRGCCSHHGGVAGCNSSGRQICNDGTLSPSCTCTPVVKEVYGCTDKSAYNYNSKATKDNGSCKYYIYGCTDKNADNYNSKANKDDGSCTYIIYGCTDNNAINFDSTATENDGTCEYHVYGCTDKSATNYNSSATKDDGSCEYKEVQTHIEETTESKKEEDSSGEGVVFGVGTTALGIYLYKTKKKKK